MNTRNRSVRAAVVLAATGTLLLSGCGEDQADGTRAVSHSAPASPSVAPKATLVPKPGAEAEPVPEPVAAPATARAASPRPESEEEPVPVENVPTELPPGDPGLDAAPAPDPGKPEHDREHEEPARTEVPAEAMLDAGTVSAVLGGDWQQQGAVAATAPAWADAAAERSTGFAADGTGELLQAVATHRSLAAADRAVGTMADQLAQQGWTRLSDPRLGTASAALRSADGSRTAVLISAEAVTVALVGSGSATSQQARWASLQDLVLGTSCAAAPHGCH